MLLLTDDQLHEIKRIIKKHHAAVIAGVAGLDALTPEEAALLAAGKLTPEDAAAAIEDSYLYGQVLAQTETPAAQAMTYDEFREHVEATPIPLTPQEQASLRAVKHTVAQSIRGLGNRVDAHTGQLIIEADAKLRAVTEAQIKQDVTSNIQRRETVGKLKSDLGWAAKDWSRDMDRIAVTEKHNAMQQGLQDGIAKEHGKDALVFKRPLPGACKHCLRLHLDDAGIPRVFKLSTLRANGTNVSRKAGEWRAVVGATHPWCQCQLVYLPDGWGFDEDGQMSPDGELGKVDATAAKKSVPLADGLRKSYAIRERLIYQGLPIAIENRAGESRKWRDLQGRTGSTRMHHAYGFVEGTRGTDGDEYDVFVGPSPNAPMVYVVHQRDPVTGAYDEDKALVGFDTMAEARECYFQHYDDPGFFGEMTVLTI